MKAKERLEFTSYGAWDNGKVDKRYEMVYSDEEGPHSDIMYKLLQDMRTKEKKVAELRKKVKKVKTKKSSKKKKRKSWTPQKKNDDKKTSSSKRKRRKIDSDSESNFSSSEDRAYQTKKSRKSPVIRSNRTP